MNNFSNFRQFILKPYMELQSPLLSQDILLDLYKKLLKPGLIEEKMLILIRQGKVSKWFSGIGQEAISVGVTSILQNDEYILPMHRNLGVFTSRNIPLRSEERRVGKE